jgi:hypothetical protein
VHSPVHPDVFHSPFVAELMLPTRRSYLLSNISFRKYSSGNYLMLYNTLPTIGLLSIMKPLLKLLSIVSMLLLLMQLKRLFLLGALRDANSLYGFPMN